jgi:hypothetical protein
MHAIIMFSNPLIISSLQLFSKKQVPKGPKGD